MRILNFAQLIEKNTHASYVRAAELATDEFAQRMFRALAQEEASHERMLEGMEASSSKSSGTTDLEKDSMGRPNPVAEDNQLSFSEKDSLATILKKAIKAERANIQFYQGLEKEVCDEDERRLCRELCRQERMHEKVLKVFLDNIDNPECVLEATEFAFLKDRLLL